MLIRCGPRRSKQLSAAEALSQSGHAAVKLAASGVAAVSLGYRAVPAIPLLRLSSFIIRKQICIGLNLSLNNLLRGVGGSTTANWPLLGRV